MGFDPAKPFRDRRGTGEPHALDGEAGFRRHAAGILKRAPDIAIAARLE